MDYRALIENFSGCNVMVVGDVMIDAYLRGSIDRMSPEAPDVPVVSIDEEIYRLGGAANVALNIKTLGGTPIICSVIGKRKEERFLSLLRNREFSEAGIVVSNDRKTTQKTRVISSNAHLLRVDEEDVHDLSNKDEQLLLNRISKIITDQKVEVMILQDYNKGVLTENLIKSCIELANDKHIPVAVDPKLKHFLAYENVELFKPNLKEINEGLELEVDGSSSDQVLEAMELLEAKLKNKISFVTLSEFGVAIKSSDDFLTIPAHPRKIVDVSGAGDTVISVAALCLSKNCSVKQLAELSNLAGGLVCEEVGVVPIEKEKLIQEALRSLNVS